MNNIYKTIHFLAIFFIPFYLIRVVEIIPSSLLNESVNGAAWLYSAMATIFGMVSAFIIQNQWNRWDNLVNTTKGEINSLKELIMISSFLTKENKNKIKVEIKNYLNCLINKESWKQIDKGQTVNSVEETMINIQRHVFDISENETKYSKEIIRVFGKLKSHRNNRLRYGAEHLPSILNLIISFSTYSIIIFSMLIYIENIYIDLLFTGGISILVFLIYTIIKDLNHPYKPGSWHLAKNDYKSLLAEIK